MPAARLLIGGVCLLAAIGAAVSCRPATEAMDEPSRLTLELFELARQNEPDAARLDQLFEMQSDERWQARLYDALEQLGSDGEVEIEGVEPLEGLERVVVDVARRLRAEGEARYSVQLGLDDQGRWKVVAFDGPGVSWPRRGRQGTGLSTWPEQ